MPYFMELQSNEPRYPEICTVCCGSGPLYAMERRFTQGTGFYGVAYTTRTTTLSFPTCGPCRRRLGRLLLGAWALMVLPWGFVCMSGNLSNDEATSRILLDIAMTSAVVGLVTGITLLFYRGHLMKNLRVVHTTRDGIVFGSNSEEYARAFSELNRCTVEKKLFYIRTL